MSDRTEALWESYRAYFGAGKVQREYPDKAQAMRNWEELLNDVRPEQFRKGLRLLKSEKHMPNLPSFRALCFKDEDDRPAAPARITPVTEPHADNWQVSWQNRLMRFIMSGSGMSGSGRYYGPLPYPLPKDWKPHPCDLEMQEVRVQAAESWAVRCRIAFGKCVEDEMGTVHFVATYLDEQTGEVIEPDLADLPNDEKRKLLLEWWDEHMKDATEACNKIWDKYEEMKKNHEADSADNDV